MFHAPMGRFQLELIYCFTFYHYWLHVNNFPPSSHLMYEIYIKILKSFEIHNKKCNEEGGGNQENRKIAMHETNQWGHELYRLSRIEKQGRENWMGICCKAIQRLRTKEKTDHLLEKKLSAEYQIIMSSEWMGVGIYALGGKHYFHKTSYRISLKITLNKFIKVTVNCRLGGNRIYRANLEEHKRERVLILQGLLAVWLVVP